MIDWIGEGKLKPHVSTRYTLEDTGRALRDMAERRVIGKVVITRAVARVIGSLIDAGSSGEQRQKRLRFESRKAFSCVECPDRGAYSFSVSPVFGCHFIKRLSTMPDDRVEHQRERGQHEDARRTRC